MAAQFKFSPKELSLWAGFLNSALAGGEALMAAVGKADLALEAYRVKASIMVQTPDAQPGSCCKDRGAEHTADDHKEAVPAAGA